ncbi:MarR family winged helix-turn-helix transcriptional regulator [Aestuariimicrobium ganziense]|uniref:MarR family winged helix-turn-helix transcriptional regulator n=1 Tax=Aestuariimicrobium ganziense TaxID=2773677 RepID=UPI0019444082|nr:hypothetical protein [Aestuariimicrobium ganziense]
MGSTGSAGQGERQHLRGSTPVGHPSVVEDEHLVGTLKGLAIRSPDPDDRRAIRVHVTDQGRAVLEQADRARDLVHEEVFAALDESERAHLQSLLNKLDEH